jgi:hypothetical protein
MVPVSLWISLVVEGTALLSAGPWTVAVEHGCQICCLSALPGTQTPYFCRNEKEGDLSWRSFTRDARAWMFRRRTRRSASASKAAAARATASTVTTWGAMTATDPGTEGAPAPRARDLVVMEATSDYWRPFYYLLEGRRADVVLVNARDARNVPGRKTDVSDAAWLADLGAHGLVRASFVPPPPIRELRDLTRARTVITRERTREIQRLEKLLEDACIKLSSVASDITGVSGRLMLQALIDGQNEPQVLAELAQGRMRPRSRTNRGADGPVQRPPPLHGGTVSAPD